MKRDGTVYVTGIPVSGSKRHVSKTHGTHNGRTDSWPHVSDALDRPRKLGGEAVSSAPRWKGGKVRAQQTRVNPFNYQDPGVGISQSPSWSVCILVKDWFRNIERVETIGITANCEAAAKMLAWRIAEDADNILPLEFVGCSSG